MEVFKVFATLGIDATAFDKGLAGAEQRLNHVEESFNKAGRTLSMGVTAPLVGLAGAALKTSIDFESAFAGVRKTVDATEEEFAMLEAGIRRMSSEIPASATAIAEVAEAAGQLGIQTENILAFSETMIGLGESTNMTATEAATALARFANIVQMPQTAIDQLGSTIVELGNNLATTEGEIVEMGLRIAGAGNLIGLTEPEIMGVAGALSSLGIRAEAGGTSISKVFRTIMSAVLSGGADLQAFADVVGITAEEFATTFETRPIDATVMFAEALARIKEEGGNVEEALNNVGITEYRASDALLKLAGSGDVLAASINMATGAWHENTALQEEVGRRYETTESQLKMLWNTLSEVVRTLGDALIPFLLVAVEAAKPFIAALQGLAEWFSNLDPRMQAFIVAGAGILAAIGPVLMIIGSFAGAITNLLPLLSMLPGAIGAIGTAFTILTGPVGAVIAIVSALVYVFATDFLGIRTAVVNAWHAIVDAFTYAVRNIRTSLLEAKTAITDWWDKVVTFFRGIPDRMLQFGKDMITGLVNGLKSMVGNAVDSIRGVGDSIVSGFKNLLGIASPSTVFYELGQDIGQGLANGIDDSQATVMAAVTRLADIAAGVGRAIISGAYDPQDAVQGLIQGLTPEQARAVLEQRHASLTDMWRRLPSVSNMHGQRTYLEGMVGAERDAIADALAQTNASLAKTNQAVRDLSNQLGSHVQRLGFHVDSFGQDVRGMTLAKQRY